jgi:ribonuclease HII
MTKLTCGVDEAGRGAWAGPVVAAAVILDAPITGLADSKKLSARKREQLSEEIKANSRAWNIATVESQVIDEINILQATLLAMRQAVLGLKVKPTLARIDGRDAPNLDGIACETLIKGDSLAAEISVASILAKVERDRLMCAFEDEYPGYGFCQHKGYGVAAHRDALDRLGVCTIHRLSYRPVAAVVSRSLS